MQTKENVIRIAGRIKEAGAGAVTQLTMLKPVVCGTNQKKLQIIPEMGLRLPITVQVARMR